MQPKYQLTRTPNVISLTRDNILLRITPSLMKFQLDRLGDDPTNPVNRDHSEIQRASTFTKALYGVFGYIKLKKYSYLILIEEASVVGTMIRGTVMRVDKLMFVPLYTDSNMDCDPADMQYIDMINKIQSEKAFYFSYDIDLTKNI